MIRLRLKFLFLLLICFITFVIKANSNVLTNNNGNINLSNTAIFTIGNCQVQSAGYLVKFLDVNDPQETEIFPFQIISVQVTQTGTYEITTNIVNGVRFRSVGTFTTLGLQNVTLQAEGTPQNHGNFQYSVENCNFSRNVYVADRRYKDVTTQGQNADGLGGVTTRHHRFIYKIFESSQTSEEWMQTNLGAYYNKVGHPSFNPDAIPASVSDYNAFGSVFQWGRYSDGHELINWISGTENINTSVNLTTVTTVTGDVANHNRMILSQQWQQTPNSNLWQGESGLNNPCPKGFRVPLQSEYTKESTLNGFQNINDAFNSDFKIVGPGARRYQDGLFENPPGVQSVYWTSGVQNQNISYDYHFQSTVYEHSTVRGFAFCVRCILLKYEFSICEDDSDGVEQYPISNMSTEIQSDYPNLNVTFYDNYENAYTGTSQGQYIDSVTVSFINNPNIIYARLSDSDNNTTDVIKINIYLYTKPQVDNPPTLYYCTSIGSSIGLFDLTSVEEEIDQSIEELYFTYYQTSEGAEGQISNQLINNPSTYYDSASTVYVRVQNEFECGYIIKPIPLVIAQQTISSQQLMIPVICTLEPIINLEEFISELTNGESYSELSFHTTEVSAQSENGSDMISNPQEYEIPDFGQDFQIFVRIKQFQGLNCNPVISSLNIKVVKIPEIFLNDSSDLRVCAGTNVLLQLDTDADTLNWYSSQTSDTIVFTGLEYYVPELTSDTTFWVEASNEFCQTERIEIYVIVSDIPGINIPQDNFLICEDDNLILYAYSDIGQIYWYDSDTATTPLFVGNNYQLTGLNNSQDLWVEAVSNASCISERKKIQISVLPQPSIIVTNQEYQVCSGETVSLEAFSEEGIIRWYAQANSILPEYTGFVFTIYQIEDSKSYWVESYNQVTGCVSERLKVDVIVIETPEIITYFEYDMVCKPNQSVFPRVPDNFTYGGTFSSSDDLDIDPSTGEIAASNNRIGSYIVTYRINQEDVPCGYSSEFYSTVTVAMCYIPKGISPNGDGFNDFLDLTGMQIAKIVIYNRYGKEVFSRSNYEKEWYGQDNRGQMLPEATYFYSIVNIYGEEMTGYIYLSREVYK